MFVHSPLVLTTLPLRKRDRGYVQAQLSLSCTHCSALKRASGLPSPTGGQLPSQALQ